MNQKRVIDCSDIATLLGVSKATVWRMDAAGQIPKSFKLSPGQTVWDCQEIEDWLEAKKAARFTAPTAPVQRGRNPVATSNNGEFCHFVTPPFKGSDKVTNRDSEFRESLP